MQVVALLVAKKTKTCQMPGLAPAPRYQKIDQNLIGCHREDEVFRRQQHLTLQQHTRTALRHRYAQRPQRPQRRRKTQPVRD